MTKPARTLPRLRLQAEENDMADNSRWGYTTDQWNELIDTGYDFLARVAAEGGMTNYTILSENWRAETGLNVPVFGDPMRFLLGDIAIRSYRERGVVLTALVEYKDRTKTQPAVGFLNISVELGIISEPATMTEYAKDAFWVEQIQASHAAYR